MTVAAVIGLVALGLLLVVLEVLVIPGFGVFGVLGALAIFASGTVAYIYLGAVEAAGALVAGLGLTGVLVWWLPRTRLMRSMALEACQSGAAPDPELVKLAGREGQAVTVLHPAGAARIDGRLVDVVTDGQYVDRGAPLRVVSVEGARVVVEPVEGAAAPGEEQR